MTLKMVASPLTVSIFWDLSRESLHNTVGMVLQDTWIFTGTIADNMATASQMLALKKVEYDDARWRIALSVTPYPMDAIRFSTGW